ncbi:MAG: outer membrane lipoprotein-sorting protein [Bacteriovoracaceae bacterium]
MKHIFFLGWLILFHVLGWSSWQVTKLRTEYSVDQFYPKEHPLLLHHDEIRKEFRLHEEQPYLYVITYPREETWVEPGKIERLKKLSTSLEEMEGVARVISLSHVEGASEERDELVIGSLFDRVPPQNWKSAVINNPLLYPLLVTKDFRSTLIMVESSSKNRTVMEELEKKIDREIKKVFPDASVESAGVPLLQARLSHIIQKELGHFLLYTAGAFCFLFLILFTHISAMFVAFATLFISNLFSLALMAAFEVPMNAILVTLPVIVSVSIMSLLIHTLHLWSQRTEGKSGEERLRAAWETMKELALPNALGILTTAMGFLALSPSPIPLISEYGKTVAIVLTFVAVVSQIVMLIALPLVNSRLRKFVDGEARWTLSAIRKPKSILFVTAIIFSLGIKDITGLNFSLRLFDDLPENDPVRKTTEWIDSSFGGVLSYELKARAQEENFWKAPENLRRLSELGKELRSVPGTRAAVSVSDFFQGRLPADENAVAETYFLFSMAEKNPLNSFLTEDARSTRIGIRLSDLMSNEISATKEKIISLARTHFPELTFTEGGMANYAHDLNQEVARSLIFEFWQPLLFIGLFLVLIFRSVRWAVIACLPNFIPPAVLITSLSFLDVQVKPGIALIFSIALGFAFNNTLYVLTRLRTLRGKEKALETAVLMEGNACLLESLIMFTGFAIFLTSEFDMNQNFGGFMLLSIMAGFFADLYFLPAFLKVFPQALRMRSAPPASVAASLIILLMASPVWSQSAEDILKKSKDLIDAKDDQAEIEMIIIEKNGEKKSRKLALKTLREEGFSVLARIDSPADIKNMAFLGQVDTDGNEKQWIYLPSSGQVRRLVTGKTKAGLLGSEISPEDLNSEAVKGASSKLTKIDKDYYWIEVIPAAGTSDYSKVVTKISKADHLPKYTAYYMHDKLKKTISFKDYKKFGPVFRAQHMVVQNHQNGRATEVRLSSVKVNTGLSSDDFTQSSLKD